MYPTRSYTNEPYAPPAISHVTLHSARRGDQTLELKGPWLRLGIAEEAEVHVAPEEAPDVAPIHAVLLLREDGYTLRATPGQHVTINGETATERKLSAGDVVQLGSATRLSFHGESSQQAVSALEGDTSGPRLSRSSPILERWAPAGGTLCLLLLGFGIFFTYGSRLDTRLERAQTQVASLEERLQHQESNRQAHSAKTTSRLDELESRIDANHRIIRRSSQSVIFLQGSYGFRDRETGLLLRYGTDGAGRQTESDLILHDEGPLVETPFMGSAFVATSDGLLVTNRHVVRPWELDSTAEAMALQGMEPVILKFLGYLADSQEALEVEAVTVSEEVDLAVLRFTQLDRDLTPLPLDSGPPQVGDEVLLLGYPAGVRGLLARADDLFVKRLLDTEAADGWTITQRLAERGGITPLATRGIVGHVSDISVVYDAETTSGGSGAPVLNHRGLVVAVNNAIVPEFGGSNIGIPIEQARLLLDSINPEAATPRSESSSGRLDGNAATPDFDPLVEPMARPWGTGTLFTTALMPARENR